MTLKEAMAYMNSWRGFYAPRLREQGNWVVQAAKGDKGGEGQLREHYKTLFTAQKRVFELQREGFDVREPYEDLGVPEELYQKLRVLSAQQLLDKALEKGGDILDPQLATKFKEDLIKLSSDLIRARGFRSHMIKRRKDSLVSGYIRDPLERIVRYTSNLSAGVAKNETAELMMAAMQNFQKEQGKDIEPRVYAAAQRYIEEQMRNNDNVDRAIGMLKSVASLKYLGMPNVRAPFINTTAIATTTPPAIQHYALGGKGKFRTILRALMKAGSDYRKYMTGKTDEKRLRALSTEEVAALDKYTSSGWTKPQQTMDVMGKLQGQFGRRWAKLMGTSMWLFGKTEQWNRGTSFLAAYRLARKQGQTDAQAYKSADLATKRAHGVYGKATLPSWAQGSNPLSKVGQLFYVYKKFAHNWLQMAYDLGVKQHNMKAFAWAMLSPVILGGTSSIAFKSIFFGLVMAMMKAMGDDRDPEKIVFDGIREHFGDTTERTIRYGVIAGYLMNSDISGSLSVDADMPPKIQDLMGAPGGVLTDIGDAWYYLTSGQPTRSLEVALPVGLGNLIRAGRETSGVTTRRGRAVFDAKDKLFIPTAGETVKRALGFRSARVATTQARSFESKKEKKSFANRRTKIYELYRSYLVNRDLRKYRKVIKLMKEYNKDLRKSGRGKKLPKMTTESLKRQAKAFNKPPKSERR
jgi:hypothetical protein